MASEPKAKIHPFKVEIFHHARESLGLHPEIFSLVTKQPGQESFSQLAKLGLYKKYGVVWLHEGLDEAEALSIAYERTGTSMLGDVFVLDGKPFIVAMYGFNALEGFDLSTSIGDATIDQRSPLRQA